MNGVQQGFQGVLAIDIEVLALVRTENSCLFLKIGNNHGRLKKTTPCDASLFMVFFAQDIQHDCNVSYIKIVESC